MLRRSLKAVSIRPHSLASLRSQRPHVGVGPDKAMANVVGHAPRRYKPISMAIGSLRYDVHHISQPLNPVPPPGGGVCAGCGCFGSARRFDVSTPDRGRLWSGRTCHIRGLPERRKGQNWPAFVTLRDSHLSGLIWEAPAITASSGLKLLSGREPSRSQLRALGRRPAFLPRIGEIWPPP